MKATLTFTSTSADPHKTYGTAAPTTGTHTKDEIVWNSNPVAGGNIGWVCLTAGSPGVWAAFGVISL